jgi:hypothetical protein
MGHFHPTIKREIGFLVQHVNIVRGWKISPYLLHTSEKLFADEDTKVE